jgi:hypothetical protein
LNRASWRSLKAANFSKTSTLKRSACNQALNVFFGFA